VEFVKKLRMDLGLDKPEHAVSRGSFERGLKLMRSDAMKKGIERAPQRAALYAVGINKSDLDKPFIGVINASSEIPGHLQLDNIANG
jgi:dihydroxyacid dehydratase/phosphogluconate dehydratase